MVGSLDSWKVVIYILVSIRAVRTSTGGACWGCAGWLAGLLPQVRIEANRIEELLSEASSDRAERSASYRRCPYPGNIRTACGHQNINSSQSFGSFSSWHIPSYACLQELHSSEHLTCKRPLPVRPLISTYIGLRFLWVLSWRFWGRP